MLVVFIDNNSVFVIHQQHCSLYEIHYEEIQNFECVTTPGLQITKSLKNHNN